MMVQTFEYRFQARRPLNYMAFGLGVFTACMLIATQAKSWTWAPVLIYLGIVFSQLCRNHSRGLRLTLWHLEWYVDDTLQETIPLQQILRAKVRTGLFAPNECTLELSDGRRFLLPFDTPPRAHRLREELAARGVRLA